MWRHLRLLTPVVVVLCILLVACAGGDGDATSGSAPVESSTTAGPVASMAAPVEVGAVAARTVNGRDYYLYVPDSYDPSVASPLMLAHHGLGESPWSMVRRTQPLADTQSVVIAYPAADNSQSEWDFASDADWSHVKAVLDDVETAVNVDPERIFAIGHSQGGSFSTFLACHLGDRLAGIVTNVSLNHHDLPACSDVSPVDLLAIIWDADPVTSIGADFIRDAYGADPVSLPDPWPEEADQWAATNACDPAVVDTDLGDGVTHRQYSCRGARFEVLVHQRGHVWAGENESGLINGFNTNEAIWEFFAPSP